MSAGRNINSLSQSWGTPHKYVKAVKQFFGGPVALDPCSNEYSIVGARVEYLQPANDGLRDPWNYPTIFVNPPYGRDKENKTSIRDWLARCSRAHSEHGSEVLALVPVAVNTSHWKRHVFTQASAVCFLYDTRLRFLENGSDKGKGAPMACSMVYWGERQERFQTLFTQYGAVIDIRPLIGTIIGEPILKAKVKATKRKVLPTPSFDFDTTPALVAG